MSRRGSRVPIVALAGALLASTVAVTAVSATAPTIIVPTGTSPTRVIVDPVDRLAYIGGSDAFGAVVTVVDADTGVKVGDVALPGSVSELALDPAGGGVLVGNGTQMVQRVRGATLSLAAPISLPYQGLLVATDPSRSRLFVATNREPTRFGTYHVLAIDLSDDSLLANVSIPRLAGALAVDPEEGVVYATHGSSVPDIDILDEDDLSIVGTISMPDAANDIELDGVRHRLYITDGDAGVPHTIFDTGTRTVIGSLPSSGVSHAVAVDANTGRVFVTSGYPNPTPRVDIFEADVLVDTAPMTGVDPIDIAVDAVTGNAWVVDQPGATVTVIGTLAPPVDTDLDDDGTADDVDADGGDGTSPAGAFSDDTGDGHTTTGSVTSTAGLSVDIADVPDPAGLSVTVGTGSGHATLSVCGGFVLEVEAASSAVVTCGSVTVSVTTGSARIALAGGLGAVLIPAGASAKVTDTGGGTFSVANVGPTGSPAVTLTVDGVSTAIGPGTTTQAAAWDFAGFSQPVDNAPVVNRATAGLAIPVKWRILGASGAPVTTLASARLTVTGLSCALGSTVDLIEETAPGDSGLKNLGNGYYQLNWKSPKSYASSCKVLHLDIGDGVLHDALFQFTK